MRIAPIRFQTSSNAVRFLVQCEHALNDRRENLSEENTKKLAILYYNGGVVYCICMINSLYETSPLNMKRKLHEISSLKRNLLKLEMETG